MSTNRERAINPTDETIFITVGVLIAALLVVLSLCAPKPDMTTQPYTGTAALPAGILSSAPVTSVPEGPLAVTDELWQSMFCHSAATTAHFDTPVAGKEFNQLDSIKYTGHVDGLLAGHTVRVQLLEMRTGQFRMLDRKAAVPATDKLRSSSLNGGLKPLSGPGGPYKLVAIMADKDADIMFSSLAPHDHMITLFRGLIDGACIIGGTDIRVNG
jgi:hypothetical protein